MQLQCKQCGAPIKAEDINMQTSLAVCAYCDTVFNFGEDSIPPPSFPEKRKRGKLKTPRRMEVLQHKDGTEIHYSWFSTSIWGMVFFAVVWNGFLVFWIGIALSQQVLEMILFSGIHILVGLFFLYNVLTTFLNGTSIMIQPRGLIIRHGPLPTFTNRSKVIDRRRIEQVYCKRRVRYTQNDVPVYCFDVHIVTKGADSEVLVRGLDKLEKALFIEQQIEQMYVIEDQPVPDEYEGTARYKY